MKFKNCDECPAKCLCKSTSGMSWGYGGLECIKFLNAMEKKLTSHNSDYTKCSKEIIARTMSPCGFGVNAVEKILRKHFA